VLVKILFCHWQGVIKSGKQIGTQKCAERVEAVDGGEFFSGKISAC
jgi:hypothetical protein